MPVLTIACPFCGEELAVGLDDHEGRQSLITDCETCCRPMEVRTEIKAGEVTWSEVDI